MIRHDRQPPFSDPMHGLLVGIPSATALCDSRDRDRICKKTELLRTAIQVTPSAKIMHKNAVKFVSTRNTCLPEWGRVCLW